MTDQDFEITTTFDDAKYERERKQRLTAERERRDRHTSEYNELAAGISAATGKPYEVKAKGDQWFIVDTVTNKPLTKPHTGGIFVDLINAVFTIAVQAGGYTRDELNRERERLGLPPRD